MLNVAATQFGKRADEWPAERIAKLERDEVEQLRHNAAALGESEIVSRCEAVLATRSQSRRAAPSKSAKARRLISRSAAFEARGVYLANARTSWSGVRRSDGVVVIGIWADAVQSRDGGCSCLLWAPNSGGSQPWSDTAAGQERRQHCELAVAAALAEGLLVYGERLDGHVPEDKARSVHGVDPLTVVHLRVEKRGPEYWAVWGKRADSGLVR
ncbi:MAG: hypothetical protein E6H77_02485 [Betaproteobacteria bacterium]|nr:MAG: hypothetical protein E6H77_02485 [Betaproteobacteria bacterium]